MGEHEDPATVRDGIPDYAGGAEGTGENGGGRGFARAIDWGVAAPALILVLAIAVWAILIPEGFGEASKAAFQWLVGTLGWAFIIAAVVFFVAMIALAFSSFGHIRLGRDGEKPEFSTVSWIAMMFAAGMGIGLLFYGGYEPLYHYRNGVPGHAPGSSEDAFAHTLLHWGPVAWATYAVVGGAIAYSTFRMGRPQLISAACAPLIGERRSRGWLGKIIDIMAIFATVFGTAMSLGLGASQISEGFRATGLIADPGLGVMLVVIGVLSVGYLASAMSGVARGVQIMSNINMGMAAAIAVFVLVTGPTVAELDSIPMALGSFLDELFEMTSRSAVSADGTAGEWLGSWTIFYWVWWVSWTPFVGMFLARISRGRTIREFVVGIVVVPSTLTLLWFAIFGGTAIEFERTGRSIWGDGSAEAMLFAMLRELPWNGIVPLLTMVLLATFFITTADSASTVMGTMSQRGRVNPTPWVSGVWGLMTTLIAVAMLLSGGTDILSSLQTIIIVAGSPFLLVVIALLASLIRGVANDPSRLDEKEARKVHLRMLREQRAREKEARTGRTGRTARKVRRRS
ncbi:BCCT family transporter [Corynebacterium hansenii]|uniref:BCCT family transporter n=1 Tax=Corynebacterium hansenii TaxID=394964 RepID=A0ABV7ZPW4_9CORY|nr:BCCT family transporter [Corynebacterium hansenii]WJZ00799.1 Glycine betaine transporter BetP [Corynebacterium hansenii]